MEAGRAIQRGLVSPDRTTLIASHRVCGQREDRARRRRGRSGRRLCRRHAAAKRSSLTWPRSPKTRAATSASLFGALAGSGALPFRGRPEETVAPAAPASRQCAPSRAAMIGRQKACPAHPPPRRVLQGNAKSSALQPVGHARFDLLVARVAFAAPPRASIRSGRGGPRPRGRFSGRRLRHRISRSGRASRSRGVGRTGRSSWPARPQIARAMAYDDVIRVADLRHAPAGSSACAPKWRPVATRSSTTEFMHPGMEEVCGTLPAAVGQWIEARPRLFAALQRLVNRGRRVNTATLRWFLPLYVLAGMRRFRRTTLRHRREQASRDAWLVQAQAAARRDIPLATRSSRPGGRPAAGPDMRARRRIAEFGGARRWRVWPEGRMPPLLWVRRLRQAALAADARGWHDAGTTWMIESWRSIAAIGRRSGAGPRDRGPSRPLCRSGNLRPRMETSVRQHMDHVGHDSKVPRQGDYHHDDRQPVDRHGPPHRRQRAGALQSLRPQRHPDRHRHQRQHRQRLHCPITLVPPHRRHPAQRAAEEEPRRRGPRRERGWVRHTSGALVRTYRGFLPSWRRGRRTSRTTSAIALELRQHGRSLAKPDGSG